jgi:hypothetical protein
MAALSQLPSSSRRSYGVLLAPSARFGHTRLSTSVLRHVRSVGGSVVGETTGDHGPET